MFLVNITKWGKRKLNFIWLLFELLYLGLALVGPLVTICIKYDLFAKPSSKTISGFAMIIILIFAILGLRSFKKVIFKLNDITRKQQILKYNLEMFYALAVPLGCALVLFCFKDDFNLAYSTFCIALSFYLGSILVDYLFIKYIDKERYIRQLALEKITVQDRIDGGVV